jgi:hypothetical protein
MIDAWLLGDISVPLHYQFHMEWLEIALALQSWRQDRVSVLHTVIYTVYCTLLYIQCIAHCYIHSVLHTVIYIQCIVHCYIHSVLHTVIYTVYCTLLYTPCIAHCYIHRVLYTVIICLAAIYMETERNGGYIHLLTVSFLVETTQNLTY